MWKKVELALNSASAGVRVQIGVYSEAIVFAAAQSAEILLSSMLHARATPRTYNIKPGSATAAMQMFPPFLRGNISICLLDSPIIVIQIIGTFMRIIYSQRENADAIAK
jgi:hypothetical protein